jgi:hypothetical protein
MFMPYGGLAPALEKIIKSAPNLSVESSSTQRLPARQSRACLPACRAFAIGRPSRPVGCSAQVNVRHHRLESWLNFRKTRNLQPSEMCGRRSKDG